MQVFQATPGDIVGERFRLVERLGKTTNADTWRARDVNDADAPCVVKILGGADLTNVDQLRAFEREARVLKSLSHPGVPGVRGAVTDARGAYILGLDEIDGIDLAIHLNDGPRLGEDDVIAAARGLLDVLDYLHTRSPPVFHRDIKPSNVVRRADGTVVLVDFGAVCDGWRAAHTIAVGTLGYMAPEQLHGQVSPRSDLYALGATLLHMATGLNPSECVDRHTGALRIPKDVALDVGLATLIGECIRQSPGDRPATAKAALRLLEAPVVEAPRPVSLAEDGELVWNAARWSATPRDPNAERNYDAFRYFSAAVRPRSGWQVFLHAITVIAFLTVPTWASQSEPKVKSNIVILCLVGIAMLWGVVFAIQKSSQFAGEKQPNNPVFKAFRNNPIRTARIIDIRALGGKTTGLRVRFQWTDAPHDPSFSANVRLTRAEKWLPGQLVRGLVGPNGRPVLVFQDFAVAVT